MTISVPDFGTPPVVRYAEPATRLAGSGAAPAASNTSTSPSTVRPSE